MKEFKYAELTEEPTIEEIDKEIKRLQHLANAYNNEQMGIKIFLNSIYGACASVYFVCYNPDLAEAITLQGQDIIKFSALVLNKYFKEIWHKDKKLHEKLGLTHVEKVELDVSVYGDTDSIDKDSILRTNKGSISIEKLYENEVKNISNVEISPFGHEVIIPKDINVLNYSKNNKIVFSKVKKLIRHKVSKEKWQLKTKTGKEIFVTNDHSLIVFRNGKKIKIKPYKTKQSDKVLIITKIIDIEKLQIEYKFDEIETCEPVGNFDNEYVYDIEMDDETHTFIGNDILVHNSVYCSFEEVVNGCNYDGNSNKLIYDINKFRLKEFLNNAFEQYAKKWNTKNIQDFELESIARSAILLAKKKYVQDMAWQLPDIEFKPQEKIKASGVEIVQSSTPLFSRKYLVDILKIIFKYKKDLKLRDFVNELKKLKQEFLASEISDISFGSSIGDYEKGIANDKEKLEILPHCPMHVRGAGNHNFIINNDKKLRKKYSLIKTGDKIKYYHALSDMGECNVFSYLPGSFPYECAPSVDYEKQFEKAFIEPLNRFIDALGFQTLSSNLIISKSLF